jgi:hypothetical protein
MKAIITTYTFNAAAKTVDLSSITGFKIERLLAIINAKTGALIYAAGNAATGYATVSGNVVTLVYDTTAMANADPLTIIYDTQRDGVGDLTACPAASTNGTPVIATIPSNVKAVRFYLNTGDSLTFTIASAQPGAAPTATLTISATNVSNWDEPLSTGMNVYITAKTGNPLFRLI